MSTGEVEKSWLAAALSVSDNYCNIHSSCLYIRVKLTNIDHDSVVLLYIAAAISIIGVLGAR